MLIVIIILKIILSNILLTLILSIILGGGVYLIVNIIMKNCLIIEIMKKNKVN